jgi:ATP-dependent DNA helicase DinG
MHGELVIIDLETTGLDVTQDSIIEVGAVRLKDGVIIDRFSQLIDPEFPIPPNITHITGIRPEDVTGKPKIESVLPKISKFVRDAPLIGHNINFDADFLNRYGLLTTNLRIDTYELASVLLPRAPRYNLNSLTMEMGIELENAHRALGDATATALLYWKLWEKALALPYETLHEICTAASGLNWHATPVFEAARAQLAPQQPDNSVPLPSPTAIFEPYGKEDKALRPNEEIQGVDADKVAEVLGDNGELAQAIPGYEHRPQQMQMAKAIVNAFNRSQHLMVEAGTGTGKSIAYTVPSIIWSTLNNERVVISTNTINLQEQLIDKDIPAIKDALNIPFNASVLKGRSNYLCPRRLATVRRRRPTNVDELRTMAKILVWLLESPTGDRNEISLRGPVENITWQRLSAEDEGCLLDRCRSVMNGTCPFYKARKKAESAHLLVVNHSLLLSDAANDNRVLPDYRYLVLDEAHHLEDAVTNSLSFRLDEATLRRRLDDLGGPKKGLLGDLMRSVEASAPDKDVKRLRSYTESISDASKVMESHISTLFKSIYAFLQDMNIGKGNDYTTQVRITPSHRKRESFHRIQDVWSALHEFMDAISEAMRHLTEALARLEAYDIDGYDDLTNSTSTASRYLQEMNTQLTGFIEEPQENMIYWISINRDSIYSLVVNAAPLHIGPMVERYLWNSKDSVIMTSATMRTNGNFDYMRERLNAAHVNELEVGSPFNYEESTLLYIPKDIPEPNDRNRYQQAVERGLIELAAALNGRVLGLFTSYSHLRQTAQAITPRLALGNIMVYDQSDGSSRQALLDGFKQSERAVLLGTRSFWEGVDIPGESLSAVVIIRLPFAVPSDPIFAARSETYNNAFNDYTVPDAILRFRQGFGRLIRTKMDRGIVTIFDSRVVTKGYGASFIHAVPQCTVRYGRLDDLASEAQNWLNHTKS